MRVFAAMTSKQTDKTNQSGSLITTSLLHAILGKCLHTSHRLSRLSRLSKSASFLHCNSTFLLHSSHRLSGLPQAVKADIFICSLQGQFIRNSQGCQSHLHLFIAAPVYPQLPRLSEPSSFLPCCAILSTTSGIVSHLDFIVA